MIKNDFRYIIKKIIIGLGIFIGIFYFKSCNVYAFQGDIFYNMNTPTSNPDFNYNNVTANTTYTYKINGYNYNVQYKSNGLYVNDNLVTDKSDFLQNSWFIGIDNSNNVHFIYIYSLSTGTTVKTSSYQVSNNENISSLNYPFTATSVTMDCFRYSRKRELIFNNGSLSSNSGEVVIGNCGGTVYTGNLLVYGSSYRNTIWNNNSQLYSSTNFNSIHMDSSTINSLNPTPILSDDDSVLLGYNFTLNFDNFNNTSFVYKYRVGNSRTLILNTNNYELSIRNNDTLYVWVEDLEGNVVDSETFTIVGIGNLYQGEYSIEFTYKDIAPSDTENSTGLSNIINRVDIDITYLPKTNMLKYQYQFVNSDGSLDPQNWTQLNNDNSLNNYTYVAHSNGTLYARILNENDEVVANNTFSVDSIGKTKLFSSNNNVGGIFDSIKNNINYSGPIYSLILMPINFINTIYNNSGNTCQRYKIGTLFNNDIYFDCVDMTDYIGSNLYHLIDILCSSGVIYGIALFIKRKYNQFTSLSDNDNDVM